MASVHIVDDSVTFLKAASHALKNAGFKVTTTGTALTLALDLKKIRPDLLLLKVDIPFFSGTKALTVIRQRNLGRETKIVLCSAKDDLGLRFSSESWKSSKWA